MRLLGSGLRLTVNTRRLMVSTSARVPSGPENVVHSYRATGVMLRAAPVHSLDTMLNDLNPYNASSAGMVGLVYL